MKDVRDRVYLGSVLECVMTQLRTSVVTHVMNDVAQEANTRCVNLVKFTAFMTLRNRTKHEGRA